MDDCLDERVRVFVAVLANACTRDKYSRVLHLFYGVLDIRIDIFRKKAEGCEKRNNQLSQTYRKSLIFISLHDLHNYLFNF